MEDEESSRKLSLYQKKIKEFHGQLKKESDEDKSGKEDKLGYFSLLSRTLDLMTMHLADMTLKNYQPDILVEISHESCSIFDFYKAEEMVETGRQVARATLDSYLVR
jgi:NTE family protein